MESFEVEILKPRAANILYDLEAMKLIKLQKKNTSAKILANKKGSDLIPQIAEGLSDAALSPKGKSRPRALRPTATDYATDRIKAGKTVYGLNYKMSCTIHQIDGGVQIENDMLGIFGQGKTLGEAEKSFGEEFDYIYKRYNELPDKKLTKDVLAIKQILNLFVKNVSK
jgi:hypothetical protein